VTNLELYEALAKIPGHKLVILDACHSGLSTAGGNPIRALTPNGKGPIIMAACDSNEFSYESPKLHHGVFTTAILEALGDHFADADANGDNKLTVVEIMDYVTKRLPQLLQEIDRASGEPERVQTPQLCPKREELEPYPIVER